MTALEIQCPSGRTRVLVEDSLAALEDVVGDVRGVIVTDETVRSLHGKGLPALPIITLPAGERAKSLSEVARVYAQLAALDVDRECLLVGVGGGAVCDVTGFAAATYLRGIPCGLVPTTVLAQADAAIGGKNGVDLDGCKNQIGTIAQPRFVLLAKDVLATLPHAEVRRGAAEILKAAAVADAALFAALERDADAIAAGDLDAICPAILGAVRIKAGIVSRDERDRGERRLLNFGHTFGHALELTAGLPHGEAVAVGMVVAGRLSRDRGLLSSPEAERLEALVARLGLPTRAPGNAPAAVAALLRDKKREADAIRFVLLQAIGNAVIAPLSLPALAEVLRDLY